VAEVHAEFEQAVMQPGRVIDEKFGAVNGVFVFEVS
jgi:hypothetical protein